MGKTMKKANENYEALRDARIAQNQSRMASLGLLESLTKLKDSTPPTSVRKNQKRVYDRTCLRRSSRLIGKPNDEEIISRSAPVTIRKRLFKNEKKTVANVTTAPLPIIALSPDVLARRCDSKARGSVYDSVLGLCCHFCRQKKLCGEEDCERCGTGDIEQPCKGKSDCSVCHSGRGIFCRACLMVRYGEELDEIRENKNWMCPHCIEEKGLKPNWICNSSICLTKRKIAPTGIAIYEAREKGYKSVAHLLMAKLQSRMRN